MLWKIKGFPIIYIVLAILGLAILVYFFTNFKVDLAQEVKTEEDNQLSVLGANSLKFTAPSAAGITASQQNLSPSFGPQTPSKKPTPTPSPTQSATPTPTPSPSPTPSVTPSPTSTPTPTPTSSPVPNPPPPNPPPSAISPPPSSD